jgi:hypothetical protein
MNRTAFFPLALLCFASPIFGQEQSPFGAGGMFSESHSDAETPGVSPAVEAAPAVPSVPMTVREKFVRSTKATFGPLALVSVGVVAGYEQLTNTPGPWGQGGEAYAERFGSTFGISFVDQYTEFALAAALHEDPRYYPSADASFKARIKSALKQTLIRRTDAGGERFAYAEFGGALAGGFVANAWLPRTDNSVGDGFETAGLLIARDLGFNLIREFVPMFRHIQ